MAEYGFNGENAFDALFDLITKDHPHEGWLLEHLQFLKVEWTNLVDENDRLKEELEEKEGQILPQENTRESMMKTINQLKTAMHDHFYPSSVAEKKRKRII